MSNRHRQYIAESLLPQSSAAGVVRVRHLDGKKTRQWFTAGGFFSTTSSKMRQADLVKACALTVDVDAYDWNGAASWGPDRASRKQAMRDASEEAVRAWMAREGFVDVVKAQAASVGLPRPNRILFTGQGLNIVYWIEDAIGWTERGDWKVDRMKATIKRFHAARPDLWFWDSSAKDLGTRIFPLPSLPHRDTGKIVRVLESNDQVAPLQGWFESLEEAYPIPKKVKKAPRSANKTKKKSTTTSSGAWTTTIHDGRVHESFDVGGRGTCSICDGSGYRRLDEEHYSCFSCRTHFRVVPRAARPTAPDGATVIPLDDNGRAKWPDTVPDRLINGAATGAGKTWLMRKVRDEWLTGSHRRVIAVAPTLALAENLSSRLELDHADARSNRTWRNGSLVTCFAGLVAKSAGMREDQLAGTYILVDEVESSLLQLFGMLSGERARETYNVFVDLVAGAGRVFLADAHVGAVTRRFLADVDAYRAARGKPPLDFEKWTTEKKRFEFRYISATTRRTRKGDEVLVRSSDAQHKGLIFERLEEGKKLALYVPGRDAALGFGRAIRSRFPAMKIATVVGSTSRENENDLSVAGLTADVLIFNNAMSTGVSYDVEHYDEVHLLLSRGTVADGISVEQASHRIRRPCSKTIFVSGSVSDVVDDWRTTPDGHLRAAAARFAAATVDVHKWSGLRLAGDYYCSAESRRLAQMQATIVASRFARGYRWIVYYLAARHTFVDGVGSTNDAFVDATRSAAAAVRVETSRAIAAAIPLPDAVAERVDARGPDTEDEYRSLEARRVQRAFGSAYDGADSDERVELVHGFRHRKLATKARTFAAVSLLLEDDSDLRRQLATAEVSRNARETIMSAALVIPAARIVVELLRALGTRGATDDGRLYVPRDAARDAIEDVVETVERYGTPLRSDWRRSPIRAVQGLLAPSGLKLRSVRSGSGARQWFLANADVVDMRRIASGYIERWTSDLQHPLTG